MNEPGNFSGSYLGENSCLALFAALGPCSQLDFIEVHGALHNRSRFRNCVYMFKKTQTTANKNGYVIILQILTVQICLNCSFLTLYQAQALKLKNPK